MSSSTVAKRYALALFKLSKEQGLLERIESELRIVKQMFVEYPQLKTILKSPNISKEDRKAIIQTSFQSLHAYVLNTFMLLIDRQREDHMEEMVDEYIELVNDDKGVADAIVYTVRPLKGGESDAISSSFAAKVGKQSLRIKNVVDSDLLGGVKIRIGNRIYDGSLRGKLERLERQLLAN